jgi:hypothetical protein
MKLWNVKPVKVNFLDTSNLLRTLKMQSRSAGAAWFPPMNKRRSSWEIPTVPSDLETVSIYQVHILPLRSPAIGESCMIQNTEETCGEELDMNVSMP